MAIGMALEWLLFGISWCFGNAAEMLRQCCRDAPAMLQGCSGNAAGMLWWCYCCHAAINVAALLQLGAKQGQDVYLAGQLLPSFLRITRVDINHACYRYI